MFPTLPSRRRFLRNSALAGAALTLPECVQSAYATVPTSKAFYIHQASTQYIRSAALEDVSVMQSFGFDNDNKRLYTVQVSNADSYGTYAYHLGHGDLTVTQLDYNGTLKGHMKLHGCGHGVSIGVQSRGVGVNPWIWVEYNVDLANPDSAGAVHGRELMRFVFSNGEVIDPGDSTVHTHNVVSGMYQVTCNIDPTYNRMAVRYSKTPNGHHYYKIFNVDDVAAVIYNNPLTAEISEPSFTGGVFQGYCLFGNYLYFSNGSASSDCPGTETTGLDSYISRLDVNDPTNTFATVHSQTAYTLGLREPEGLAIQIPNTSNPTAARLMQGFAGTDNCGSSNKYASFYYKDQLE